MKTIGWVMAAALGALDGVPIRATLLQSSDDIVNPSRRSPDRLQPYPIVFNASS